MKLKVFFNSPGEFCDVKEKMLDDLYSAKERILGAAYYLTTDKFVNAINDSEVEIKQFILDKDNTDLNESVAKVVLGVKQDNLDLLMHNKFIIIDNIVWTGSFNLTEGAILKNWENMIRIECLDTADQYYNYFKRLFVWGLGNQSLPVLIYQKNQLKCPCCHKNIDDIMLHYNIVEKNEERVVEYQDSVTCLNRIEKMPSLNYRYQCTESYGMKEREKCDECDKYKKLNELVKIENYKIMKYKGADIDFLSHKENSLKLPWSKDSVECTKNTYMCIDCYYDSLI